MNSDKSTHGRDVFTCQPSEGTTPVETVDDGGATDTTGGGASARARERNRAYYNRKKDEILAKRRERLDFLQQDNDALRLELSNTLERIQVLEHLLERIRHDIQQTTTIVTNIEQSLDH